MRIFNSKLSTSMTLVLVDILEETSVAEIITLALEEFDLKVVSLAVGGAGEGWSLHITYSSIESTTIAGKPVLLDDCCLYTSMFSIFTYSPVPNHLGTGQCIKK